MASSGEGRSAAETAAGIVLSGALEVVSAGYVAKEPVGEDAPRIEQNMEFPAAEEQADQEMAEASALPIEAEAIVSHESGEKSSETLEQVSAAAAAAAVAEDDVGGDVLMMALGKRHVDPPRIQGPRDRHCWNAENEGAVLALYKAGLRPKAIKQRLQWNIPTVVVHNKITSLKRNGTITEREFPSHRRFSTRGTNSPSNEESSTPEVATAPPLSSTISGGISKSYGALPQRRSRRAVKPVQIYSPQIPTGAAVANGNVQPQVLFPPQQSPGQSKSRPISGGAGGNSAGGSLESNSTSSNNSNGSRPLNRSSSFESSLARQALVNQTRREREEAMSSDESDDEGYYSDHNPDQVARAMELGMVELKHALLEQQRQQWLHLCELTQQSLTALATQHRDHVQRTQEAIATSISAHCKALQQRMEHASEVNARRLDVLESRLGTALSMITEFVRSDSSDPPGASLHDAGTPDQAEASSSQGSSSGFSLHGGSSVDQRLDFLCRLNTSSSSVAAVPVSQD